MDLPKEPWRDEHVLKKLHVEYGYTQKEVANILGCAHDTVNDWINRLDVEGRKKAQYTDEELLNALEELAEDLGRTPTSEEMESDGCFSLHCYRDHFGTYNNAVREANLEVNFQSGVYADADWNNKETLEHLYHDKQLSAYEIGRKLDVNPSTIHNALRRHNVERRTNGEREKDAKHRDEEWLKQAYRETGYNTVEMAELAGVSTSTIRWNMEKFGIDILDRNEKAVSIEVKDGYERFRSRCRGKEDSVFHHNLVAIAHGADAYKVFDEGYVVHHKNRHPIDNRPENLEVMTRGEHSSLHHELGDMNVGHAD